MSILSGGSTPPAFTYKIVIFALAVMVLMPIFTDAYIQLHTTDDGDTYEKEINSLMDDYVSFTGQSVPNDQTVWALTGIYTPYNNTSSYGWSEDGWLYGSRVASYSPSQYTGSASAYTVTYSDGFYKYSANTNDGHSTGDLYTSVCMSANQKSNVFFTESLKTATDNGFYYTYTGYRYSFSPLTDTYTEDQDGNEVFVKSSTTSLSLIWYDYYSGATTQGGDSTGQSGIAGQLIISSNDGGVSYITSERMIQAFNSTTNMATFPMTFNGGVKCNVVIKMDPIQMSYYGDVAYCYKMGYWSLMVTSQTTNALSYTSSDYSFNIYTIWDTFVGLFTFNLSDYYDIDDTSAFVMSMIMSICMYAGLIAIGLSCYPILIMAGLLLVIQTASQIIGGWGL